MWRHAWAISKAAKLRDSPSGKSSNGRSISKIFVWSPTKSIGPPGQIVFSSPRSRENITLFHMNPTTASDSTTGK